MILFDIEIENFNNNNSFSTFFSIHNKKKCFIDMKQFQQLNA